MVPGEGRRLVTIAMSFGAGGSGASPVRGLSDIRIEVADDRGEKEFRPLQALIIGLEESMIPAESGELRRVAELGNLLAYRDLASPLVERMWTMLTQPAEEPPFGEEVRWAQTLSTVVARATGVSPSAAVVARARRAQVERIVALFSGDRRLTPDTIAASLGVSRRSLYELAEPHFGGISEYIRMARAMRAARMLADESFRDRSHAEIARATGFSSTKHMTRALLASNGLSPAALRPDTAEGRATA